MKQFLIGWAVILILFVIAVTVAGEIRARNGR